MSSGAFSAVAGSSLPLWLSRRSFESHYDTAFALAYAGIVVAAVSPSSRIGGFSRYWLVIDQRLRLEGLHYGDWFVDGG